MAEWPSTRTHGEQTRIWGPGSRRREGKYCIRGDIRSSFTRASSTIRRDFDETIQHALLTRFVEFDVQPVVIRGFHGAVTKLLMKHPGANLDHVRPCRAGRLFP